MLLLRKTVKPSIFLLKISPFSPLVYAPKLCSEDKCVGELWSQLTHPLLFWASSGSRLNTCGREQMLAFLFAGARTCAHEHLRRPWSKGQWYSIFGLFVSESMKCINLRPFRCPSLHAWQEALESFNFMGKWLESRILFPRKMGQISLLDLLALV